jgi:zinc transport system permease protein
MDDLMVRAIVAASLVGALAGMLGSFVLWKRMAYMGDAMGHASLLGVVLGLMLGILPVSMVLAVAIAVGMLLSLLHKDKRLPFDALLGVVSTGGLAAGLLLYSTLPTRQVDLYGYLFGDVLAVSQTQIYLLMAALVVQSAFIISQWRSLVRMIMHGEIAHVEDVPVAMLQTALTVMIAVTVALALQVVGMLLITAMLVVPPLAARMLSTSPAQMVFCSIGIALAASAGGVWLSYAQNLSTGPSIVAAAVMLFIASLIFGRLFKRLQ